MERRGVVEPVRERWRRLSISSSERVVGGGGGTAVGILVEMVEGAVFGVDGLWMEILGSRCWGGRCQLEM